MTETTRDSAKSRALDYAEACLVTIDAPTTNDVDDAEAKQDTVTITGNPIGALQELSQKGLLQQPTYEFNQIQAMPPVFEARVAVVVKGRAMTFAGRGKTKQDAKAAGATEALKGVKEHL